ncbi:hypothetical protein BURK2_04047 [Burkholderiales bacterium]|nr:hypothetical protein BURK2_04047 [Burkholderiales bacterium]
MEASSSKGDIPTPEPGGEREGIRRGMGIVPLKQAILDHLHFTLARHIGLATRNDWYMAVAYTVRDRMLDDWLSSLHHLSDRTIRIVSYLSAEFLMGPHLGNNLVNLGIMGPVRQALAELGQGTHGEVLPGPVNPGVLHKYLGGTARRRAGTCRHSRSGKGRRCEKEKVTHAYCQLRRLLQNA